MFRVFEKIYIILVLLYAQYHSVGFVENKLQKNRLPIARRRDGLQKLYLLKISFENISVRFYMFIDFY